MYRCALTSLGLALATTCLIAQAQTHRFFTPQTLRGEMVVTQHPDVLLNGKAARLAPGSRIKSDNDLLLQPGAITGQKLIVHYTVENSGLVMDVWVLNPAELANKPWPTTRAEAATWQFNGGNQTWIKR
jgi:hypothetical protein